MKEPEPWKDLLIPDPKRNSFLSIPRIRPGVSPLALDVVNMFDDFEMSLLVAFLGTPLIFCTPGAVEFLVAVDFRGLVLRLGLGFPLIPSATTPGFWKILLKFILEEPLSPSATTPAGVPSGLRAITPSVFFCATESDLRLIFLSLPSNFPGSTTTAREGVLVGLTS